MTPAQRYEIGNGAAENGIAASLRYYARKYPELPLKETTVQRLKSLYRLQLSTPSKSQGDSGYSCTLRGVPVLPRKKTGRPLLLGEELDTQVQEYIKHLRKVGSPVNTQIVIATAQGIILSKDANLLSNIELSKGWAKYLLKRIGFVKRKATTAAKGNVENLIFSRRSFYWKSRMLFTWMRFPQI